MTSVCDLLGLRCCLVENVNVSNFCGSWVRYQVCISFLTHHLRVYSPVSSLWEKKRKRKNSRGTLWEVALCGISQTLNLALAAGEPGFSQVEKVIAVHNKSCAYTMAIFKKKEKKEADGEGLSMMDVWEDSHGTVQSQKSGK